MKEGWDLGMRVRAVQPPEGGVLTGTLAAGTEDRPGWKLPQYAGEGFYFVKWDNYETVLVVHEEDLECIVPLRTALYKTTIVIWSENDPSHFDGMNALSTLALAREAESGNAYCSKAKTELIKDPAEDPDWDGTEFFAGDEDEDEV